MSHRASGSLRPSLPRVVVVVAAASLAVAVAMMLIGAYQVGITWDEKTNMLSLQTFFDQGWNITADALTNGEPNPAYIWGTYVYGPVSLLFTHLIATLAGAESWGHISFDAHAYAVRHVGGALIGIVGLVAAALIVRVITASWRWALLGAAMLAVVPLWVGHSMMNIKDGPVGTGYTIATLGLVLILSDRYLSSRLYRIGGLVALLGGAFLAAGTRAASGVPIAGGVVVACILWWLLSLRAPGGDARAAFRGGLRRLVEGALALVGSYLLLLLVYPKAYSNPFVLAYQAVVVSAKFPFDEPVMFAGTWVDQPVPLTYLPGWFAAQLPILVLVAAAGFVLLWFWQVIRLVMRRDCRLAANVTIMTTAVVLQALMLPVLAVVGRATMYNAVRQFTFVVPAAAVLATLGLWVLAGRVAESPRARGLGIVVWTVAVVGLLAPLASQLLLFPYNYTYYNAAAAIRPIDGTWPTDYWRASGRELMQRLPATGPESCAYEQSRKGELHACSQEPMFAPYVGERGTSAVAGELAPGQYWLVRENQGRTEVPAGCTLHDEITRRLFWQTITIGQIMKCNADAVVPPNGNLGS